MSVFTLFAIFLSAALAVTGSELYDNKKQFCCDGKVFRYDEFESSELVVCCSQEVKSYTSSECKNPKIIKQECCGGQFADIPTESNIKCCGDTYYDERNYTCFKDKVVELSQRNAKVLRRSICGDEPYTNDSFYDETRELCCGKEICYDQSFSCCNEEIYNTSSHICCSDYENMDDPDANHLVYAIVAIPNSTIPVSDYGCCNGQFMNMETQVCCKNGPTDTNGEPVKYCCGEGEFVTNEALQLCVNDTIREKEPCQNVCKDKVYNITTQHCHKGEVFDLEKGQDFCTSAEQPYSIKNELCCPDGVFNKTDDAQNSCCFVGADFDYVRFQTAPI